MSNSDKSKLTCGLVMPISAIDGVSAEHWLEVKDIITSALQSSDKYDFSVRLVSDADEAGVIQRRIVQNLYEVDVVVCDVSGKNPNVMFELGMRLAFDKPTVIIKDEKTDYSFDTGVIEQVSYPRDLRFKKIVQFKEALLSKVTATYEIVQGNDNGSTFLANFGKFTVAKLAENEVSADTIIMDTLTALSEDITFLRNEIRQGKISPSPATIPSRKLTDHIESVLSKYMQVNALNELSEDKREDALQWVAEYTGLPVNFLASKNPYQRMFNMAWEELKGLPPF